jgi:SAM-dependent methyltransferase
MNRVAVFDDRGNVQTRARGNASATMGEQYNYVLGTHDEELERLGLQHRVWRPTVLKAWAEAGLTEGSRVIDLGCGPGYALLDLAEIVGPKGAVHGIERSQKFLAYARAQSARHGFNQVTVQEADLMAPLDFPKRFDFAWCRWVACFLPELAPLLMHLRKALRAGGTAIFHEYVDYATWQGIPKCGGIERFAAEIMRRWRASGGEPDIAPAVIPKLIEHGFDLIEAKPLVFAVQPRDFMWRWPSSFIKGHTRHMVETGAATDAWAEEILQDFSRLENSADSIMITPTVMQIVARMRAL